VVVVKTRLRVGNHFILITWLYVSRHDVTDSFNSFLLSPEEAGIKRILRPSRRLDFSPCLEEEVESKKEKKNFNRSQVCRRKNIFRSFVVMNTGARLQGILGIMKEFQD
jgi:hypothetical protein